MGGELGRVAAADVAHRMDRSGRDDKTSPALTVVGGWPSARLALTLDPAA
jgi:hypothetical protein